MAVAAEALEAGAGAEGAAGAAAGGAPRQRSSSSSSAGDWGRSAQAGWQALPRGSGSSPAAQTATKLIWAAAIGLIVLEIVSEATGRYWSFSLPTKGQPAPKQAYAPLYQGQAQVATALTSYPITVTNPNPGPNAGATPGGALLTP